MKELEVYIAVRDDQASLIKIGDLKIQKFVRNELSRNCIKVK